MSFWCRFDPILRPFWALLGYFWTIWGHFSPFLGHQQSFAKCSWDTFPFGNLLYGFLTRTDTQENASPPPLPSPARAMLDKLMLTTVKREQKRKAEQKCRRHKSAFVCWQMHILATLPFGGGGDIAFQKGCPHEPLNLQKADMNTKKSVPTILQKIVFPEGEAFWPYILCLRTAKPKKKVSK